MQNKKRIFAIIQARMNSIRFIGKVMKEVKGIPLLRLLIERIKDSKLLDGVIVATTINPMDDVIVKYCEENNIDVFRGSENDLVERMLFAAKAYDVDIIVEQGVDCPLVDYELIDSTLEFYFNNDFDYVTTLNNKMIVPDGYFARVCPTKLLEKVYNSTRNKIKEGELGLFYIENNPEIYRIGIFIPKKKELYGYFRLTVDEERDLQLIKIIIENFDSIKVPMTEIIRFLKNNPNLLLINKNITHTEHFLYKIGIIGILPKNFNLVNKENYKKIAKYKFAGLRFTSIYGDKNINLRSYNNYKEMLDKESLDILVILNKDNVENYNKLLNICKSKDIAIIDGNWKDSNELNKEIENFILSKNSS